MLFHRSRQNPEVILYRDAYYPDRVEAMRRVPGARFAGWAWTFPASSWRAAMQALGLLPAHAYPYLVDFLDGSELKGLSVHVEPGRVLFSGPGRLCRDAEANLLVLTGYEEEVVERRQRKRALVSLAERQPDGSYAFPVGLLFRIIRFYRKAGAAVEATGLPPAAPPALTFPRRPELRDYQQRVVSEAPRRRRATLVMPTGAGKTRTAAGIIAALGQRTLFLTSARELVRQTEAAFEAQLGVEVGRVAEGAVRPADVTVATVQTLLARSEDEELREWLRSVRVLFVDEGHGLGARTIFEAAMMVQPDYAFALTATPQREDHRDVCIEAATGPIWRPDGCSDRELVEAGYLLPVQVTCVPFVHQKRLPQSPARRFEVGIAQNAERNELLLRLARIGLQRYQTLVLVKTLEHGEMVSRALGIPFVHGRLPSSDRQRLLGAFARRELRGLVATPLLDQGVDIPSAECLIDGVPRKSAVKILQTIGRVRRPAPGKMVARVVTIADLDRGSFERGTQRKLDVLVQAGFEVRWLDPVSLAPSTAPASVGVS